MPHRFISLKEREYPPLLREIQDPPEGLYIKGELSSPTKPSLSVVGTRKASKEGIRIAEEFSERLVRMGVVIVSGLAMGIDTAAHKGSLRAGGITVAVLGTSIDKIYPVFNTALAEEIVKNKGAVISEYSPDEPSYKGNFLKRNRIISGLSGATLVIEAPERSGSLATARFAAEQGREVFVVPGPIRDSNYKGSHGLIRDGATLVASPEEIAEDMGWKEVGEPIHKESSALTSISTEEALVIEVFRDEGTPLKVDKIIELTKLEPRMVNVGLASLTIKGLVVEEATGYKLKKL
ncbi:DNA-processing protein DprA [Patescibacteria group bacterium]|nr:DNA-processing protein DprA [Patescibacteria group bacterium]